MIARKYAHLLTAVFVCAIGTTATQAKERTIDRSALPPAVEKTVQEQSKGAIIKGFSTEKDEGRTLYEAQLIVDGHTKDIEIAADGTINEIEEEVPFDSLPSNVQNALKTKAGGAKITKTESIMKERKIVAYEAAILKGTKKGEIQVGPDGSDLKQEE